MGRTLPFALAGLFLLGLLSTAHAADRRFAVVVGYNDSNDPDLDSLKYADDDALRTAELLSNVTETVTVLAQLDEETARLRPDAQTMPPTRQVLLQALAEIREEMKSAREAGDRPVLYFVYSGHGNYDAEGRGYVHLRGGRFTTRDLYRHVIEPSEGDPVILMVDACNAALLVNSRGKKPERRVARRSTLRLEDHPNVGVILASSTVGETHEWGRYLAGIFSHEVRSGLLGPADVDDDGRVTFPELAAFVAAANARVTNPNVRVSPYIRPPLGEPDLALVDLATSSFPARIRVDSALRGRAHLLDQDLVRLADFHRGPDHSFWVALPRTDGFVIVHGEEEYLIPEGATGALKVGDLRRRPRTRISSRGAGSAYFDKTLFSEAYSREFAARYLEESYTRDLVVRRFEPLPWYQNAGAWAVLGTGVASMAAGAALHGQALQAQDLANASPWADIRHQENRRMDNLETGALVAAGAGAAALVGSSLWFLLDQPWQEERYEPQLRVRLHPQGISIQGDL